MSGAVEEQGAVVEADLPDGLASASGGLRWPVRDTSAELWPPVAAAVGLAAMLAVAADVEIAASAEGLADSLLASAIAGSTTALLLTTAAAGVLSVLCRSSAESSCRAAWA